MIEQLMNAGYNEGAARWLANEIEQGNGTLDQWTFRALDLRKVKQLNEEHAGFQSATPAAEEPPAPTTTTTKVRPNGSYSNYLAYGHVAVDGTFKWVGYPKDVLKPVYGESWGKRGGNSYEYEVSFEVPVGFKYYIVKVYNASPAQAKSIEVLYTPKER